MTSLRDLFDLPIWVAWQTETGDGGKRQIKAPYNPNGPGWAKSNDPGTWSTRHGAEDQCSRLPLPFKQGGVGVMFTELPKGMHIGGVDLDACRDPSSGQLAPWAREIVERFNSYTEVSPSNIGVKIFFIYETALRERSGIPDACTARRKGEGPKDPGIEMYLSGRYFTVTDRQTSAGSEMRCISLTDLTWLIEIAIPTFKGQKPKTQKAPAGPAYLSTEDIASAFDVIPNGDISWDEWNNMGMKIYATTDGSDEGFKIFDAWSARSTKYDTGATHSRWAHYKRSPPDHVGPGSIIFLAKQAKPDWTSPSEQRRGGIPITSDDGLGMAFTERHAELLRYTALHSQWSKWNGNYWVRDSTLVARDLARQLCRQVATRIGANRAAVASNKKVSAVLQLAMSDRRHAMEEQQWDRDPMLLATPGGTVDLRTGALRTGRPEDYMTKVTLAAPHGECPLWLQTLAQITRGEIEIMRYLQRLAGYCLTGYTSEEKIFFLHGTGRNGKGTFIETLAKVIGDYATSIAMNTLITTKHQEHPTEIAKLKGLRLALATETVDGARWNVSRIKHLTGSDRLTARFMRGDYFDFDPQHKIVASSNRKPALGVVDPAIAARMELILFLANFAIDPDQRLKQKLLGEAGGILAWAIEGCLEWQRVGLATPKRIREDTERYLREQDDIELFLSDQCARDKVVKVPVPAIYAAYQEWTQRNGAYLPSKKELTQRLQDRNYRVERGTGNVQYLYGFRLQEGGEGGEPNPIMDDGQLPIL